MVPVVLVRGLVLVRDGFGSGVRMWDRHKSTTPHSAHIPTLLPCCMTAGEGSREAGGSRKAERDERQPASLAGQWVPTGIGGGYIS